MTITLPSGGVRDWLPRLSPAPNENRSALGTNGQRFIRLGRHWAFDVNLHPMTQTDANAWSDLDEETDVLAWPIDQDDLLNDAEGTPLVAGADQLGNELDIDGATAGLVIPKGWFISVITSSRRYVYQLRSAVTVSGGGTATLPIRPVLRVAPSDNAVVEIAAPKVEGLVTARGFLRQSLSNRVASGAQFTIEERG